MYSLGSKSIERLKGVHPDMVKVVEEAIKESPLDFSITEGLRTPERQQQLFNEGKSQTLRSRHITGHAVDIAVVVDGKITWDFAKYQTVATHIKEVADNLDIPIVWGGDWVSFKDGPHFELNKAKYPATGG